MRDVSIAVPMRALEFSDEERTVDDAYPSEWPTGSQPIPVEADAMHVRHVGEQTTHRVVAAGTSMIGYECACERVIEYRFAEARPESNRGTPCVGCFTAFERRKFVPEVASTWRAHLDGPHKEKK